MTAKLQTIAPRSGEKSLGVVILRRTGPILSPGVGHSHVPREQLQALRGECAEASGVGHASGACWEGREQSPRWEHAVLFIGVLFSGGDKRCREGLLPRHSHLRQN